MIDIHSHILPGVDDGAKNKAETLDMVRQLWETGFETILATPHVMEGKDYLSPSDILTATNQVRDWVAEAEIPVEILSGAENYIFPDMAKWAREGKLLTLGNTGKYLLLELPMLEIPQYTDQVFFELQVQGLTPILAHPERYKGLVDDPERILEWAKKGVLFQLDLRSLKGRYGPKSRELAETLLVNDLIHFIGSDAHHVSRSHSSDREVLRYVKKLVGESRFQELTCINPRSVLEGKSFPGGRECAHKERLLKKKRRFWDWLRH